MKHSMESMSQRIISPWNSLLTAVLPFLPKLHDKRPQGMSRVSDESSSSFYPVPCKCTKHESGRPG